MDQQLHQCHLVEVQPPRLSQAYEKTLTNASIIPTQSRLKNTTPQLLRVNSVLRVRAEHVVLLSG